MDKTYVTIALEGISTLASLWLLVRLLQLRCLAPAQRSRMLFRQLLHLAVADLSFLLFGAVLGTIVDAFQLEARGDTLRLWLGGWRKYAGGAGLLVGSWVRAHMAATLACCTCGMTCTLQMLSELLSVLWVLALVVQLVVNIGTADATTDYRQDRQRLDTLLLATPLLIHLLCCCAMGATVFLPQTGETKLARRMLLSLASAAVTGMMLPLSWYCWERPCSPEKQDDWVALRWPMLLAGVGDAAIFLAGSCLASRAKRISMPSLGLRSWHGEWDEHSTSSRSQAGSLPRDLLRALAFIEGLDEVPQTFCEEAAEVASPAGGMQLQRAFASWPVGLLARQEPLSRASLSGSASAPEPLLSHTRSIDAGKWLSPAPMSLEELFHVQRRLGAGSFGVVRLAAARRDHGRLVRGQSYALKCIRQGSADATKARFAYRERDILQKVSHPGIVQLLAALEVDEPEPTWVLVMEYCGGGDLQQKVTREGRPGLPVLTVARYGSETLAALSYLHDFGVMHRDLKPANVLLTVSGHCKLTDFGLSLPQLEGSTLAGSPGYMAPELLRAGTHGPEADVYSWGAIVEFMLYGGLGAFCGAGAWAPPGSVTSPDDAPSAADMAFPLSQGMDATAATLAADLLARATCESPQERGTALQLRLHGFLRLGERPASLPSMAAPPRLP